MNDRQVWTVYRYYDAAGRLLYVGVTGNGHYRAHAHSRGSASWWPLVVRGEFEHFATMAEAFSEELRQITTLQPICNKADNPHWQVSRPPRETIATKREHVEGYLASLTPAQLAAASRSQVAAELTARGVPIDETYAGRILGEWRTPARGRRRGSGDDRRRGGR
jgi:hypothetical protein